MLLVAVLVLLVAAIQVVPYGRDHTNPPVTVEPQWDSPRTRELAVRACFDCHSNETVWPWYSNVAPLSWQLQGAVGEGREKLNFSEWDRVQEEAGKAAESIVDGDMPPNAYVLLHPSAGLEPAEQQELTRGLRATLGGGEGAEAEDGRNDHDD